VNVESILEKRQLISDAGHGAIGGARAMLLPLVLPERVSSAMRLQIRPKSVHFATNRRNGTGAVRAALAELRPSVVVAFGPHAMQRERRNVLWQRILSQSTRPAEGWRRKKKKKKKKKKKITKNTQQRTASNSPLTVQHKEQNPN
jgi:hypothetical protein